MPAEHAARRLGMAGGAKSAKTDYAAGRRDCDGKRTHVPTASLPVGRHCMRMMGSGSAGKEYGKDTGHVIFR